MLKEEIMLLDAVGGAIQTDWLTINAAGGMVGAGDVASLLAQTPDVGMLRPFRGADGHSYLSLNSRDPKNPDKVIKVAYPIQKLMAAGVPVMNAVATLKKDDWLLIDQTVRESAKPRLRLVGDLRGSGLTLNIPNGMAKSMLESYTMGDITPATMSMDGMRRSESDRPTFDSYNLPLPIIHKDVDFPARQVLISRNGNAPLDTTALRLASRRVAEEAEKLALGVAASYSYGGATIYGITNFPSRNTQVLTAPTAGGFSGAVHVNEILAMIQKSRDDNMNGPWMLYYSPAWGQYLDADYSATKGENTLRMRVRDIEGILDIRQLDYLTGNQVLLVQWDQDNIREVIGQDITTVQWESHGGFMLHFKVLCIMVPQLRADPSGQSGIVHGTAP
jgi:hypothetical protein